VTRAVVALVALAATAAGCGSDLGPASAPAVVPVRLQLVQGTPELATGARDAVDMVGARMVTDTSDADLVVTASPAAAAQAARVNPGTHILLVTPRPPQKLPPNVRAVQFDRGGMAYMAGALAAVRARGVAVVEDGDDLEDAFRAGTREVTDHEKPGTRRGDAPDTGPPVTRLTRAQPASSVWPSTRADVPGGLPPRM